MAVTPPQTYTVDAATQLAQFEKRLAQIEASISAGQLGNSSLQNTTIVIYDEDGRDRGGFGMQPDGGVAIVNRPLTPPPVPVAPTVMVGKATLTVRYDDDADLGSDYSYTKVYVAPPSGIFEHKGNITRPGEIVIGPLDYVQYSVALTNVNTGNLESQRSTTSFATPAMQVEQDLIDGIVTATKLAGEAVTADKVALGAIGTAKIQDNAISLAKLGDGSVSAAKIIDGAVDSGKIAAEAVGTNQLAANSVVAGKIQTGAIETDKIAANAVIAAKLSVNSVTADKIVSGAVTTAKLDALAVTADRIAANAIESAKIAAGSVTASKLQADMILASRIIAGDILGGRAELHPTNGLLIYNTNSQVIGQFGGMDGKSFFRGAIIAGDEEQGILMLPDRWNSATSYEGYPHLEMIDSQGSHLISMVEWDDGNFMQVREGKSDGVWRGMGQIWNPTVGEFLLKDQNSVNRCVIHLELTGLLMGVHNTSGGQYSKLFCTTNYSGSEFLDPTSLALRSYQRAGNGDWIAGALNTAGTRDMSLLYANQSGAGIEIFNGQTSRQSWITMSTGNVFDVNCTSAGIYGANNGKVTIGSNGTALVGGPNNNYAIFTSSTAQVVQNGTVKSFVIDHPTDPLRYLVHGCTESPTAGIEYWGTATVRANGTTEVPLPSYFESLAEKEGRIALVTPIDDGEVGVRATVSKIKNGGFTVRTQSYFYDPNTTGVPVGVEINWLVKATRKNAEFSVEPLKTEVEVGGEGPYRYLTGATSADKTLPADA